MEFVEVEKANFLLDNIDWPKTSSDQALTSFTWIVSIAWSTLSGVSFVVDKTSVKIISLISELEADEANILYLPKIDSMISDVAKKAWFWGILHKLY